MALNSGPCFSDSGCWESIGFPITAWRGRQQLEAAWRRGAKLRRAKITGRVIYFTSPHETELFAALRPVVATFQSANRAKSKGCPKTTLTANHSGSAKA